MDNPWRQIIRNMDNPWNSVSCMTLPSEFWNVVSMWNFLLERSGSIWHLWSLKRKKEKKRAWPVQGLPVSGVMQTWARIKRRVSLSISLSCHLKEEVAGRRGKWMCPQRSPPLSSLLHSAPELTFASYSYYYYLSFSLHPSLMFFFFLLSSFL